MTAAAIDPSTIGARLWESAATADAIDPDRIGEVFRHAAAGHLSQALQAANNIKKEHHQ